MEGRAWGERVEKKRTTTPKKEPAIGSRSKKKKVQKRKYWAVEG